MKKKEEIKAGEGWLYLWFAPLYGAGGIKAQAQGMPDSFLCPDLDAGFRLARAMWPGATGWTCLGPVGTSERGRKP